jgi:hypothetical protein
MSYKIYQLPNIKANNSQILNDIQSLQKLEQKLFSTLDTNLNLTTLQKGEIINRINELSKMRINLYQTMNGINTYFQTALYNSRGTLEQQAAVIKIVEDELNKAKRRLKTLEDTKNNKVRLVQINEYYGDKYAEHSLLMKIIIYTLIPMIILTAIYNIGFLPNIIYYSLLTIISIIAGIFIWFRLWSIWSRDRMNYQAYDWKFDKSKVPSSISSTPSSDPWLNPFDDLGTCIGNACCTNGMIFDNNLNQCVADPTLSICKSNTKESFTSKMPTTKKPDIILGGDNIQPNNTSSFINYSKF